MTTKNWGSVNVHEFTLELFDDGIFWLWVELPSAEDGCGFFFYYSDPQIDGKVVITIKLLGIYFSIHLGIYS